jgi:hypothetical protein
MLCQVMKFGELWHKMKNKNDHTVSSVLKYNWNIVGIIWDYDMKFSISAQVSARDSHSKPDSKAIYHIFYIDIFQAFVLLYCRKDSWTEKLRK